MTLIVGVDPGLTGAFGFLDHRGELLSVEDMPVAAGVVSTAILRDFFRFDPPDLAIVEKVASMPGNSGRSMFTFGRSLGAIEGVLGALGIPVRYVTPAKWKADAGLSKDKGQSRRRAIETWPTHAALFARVKDDGRAEAALIALHGLRNFTLEGENA